MNVDAACLPPMKSREGNDNSLKTSVSSKNLSRSVRGSHGGPRENPVARVNAAQTC